MDVKYLRDIPNYWGQLKEFKLPHFQYTVRDTKSGMLFLGFSDEFSELIARTMIDYVLARLRAQMSDVEIIVQTDNGAEFSGTTRHFERAPFTQQVARYAARHVFIPQVSIILRVLSLPDYSEMEIFLGGIIEGE